MDTTITPAQKVSDAVLTAENVCERATSKVIDSIFGRLLPDKDRFDSSVPLTVLMTMDTIGGVLTYAATLARALGRHNVTVLLAAMGGPLTDEWKTYFKTLNNVRIFESNYRLEWMENPWTDVKLAGQWLMRLAEQSTPDIVHLNNYVHAALDWPCPSMVVGHSCVYSWYRNVKGVRPPEQWRKYFCGVSSALRRADLVTAPTWSFLRSLRDFYGPFRSLGAIYNGMDADPPARSIAKEPIIFTAGRLWDEAKNIQILKKVQPLISAPICVAGSMRHPDGLTVEAGNLRHVGCLSPAQINEWYAKAAVYVLPALYEPFGLSALQAAHAGCALVLGDIPSLREIWANAALFVDPRDEEAIAGALNRLMADSRLTAQYAARAAARARLYSVDKMAARYFGLYKTLLKHEPIYSPAAAVVSRNGVC